jgi:chromosome segregation ATPase
MAEGDNFRKAMSAIVAEKEELGRRLIAEGESIAAERKKITAELAARTREVADLQAELRDRHAESGENAGRVAAAETALEQAHLAAAELGERHRAAMGEIAGRLAALEEDYAALRHENTELRRVGGPEWESEREETRRLRERLNDIAAGVMRLGESRSPEPAAGVEAIPPEPEADTPAPAAVLPAEPADAPNTLAERIRALQHAGARH